ncbi:MAG: hypothetical protein WCL06_05880 [Bacteroidota bacterium]
MKTKCKIISLIAIMIFFSAQSFASSADKTTTSNKATQVQQYINKAITYPEFAKSNGLQGFVLVQYNVNDSGKIKIAAINGSNQQLMSYVQKQLGSLKVPLGEIRDQYAKFVFKLY